MIAAILSTPLVLAVPMFFYGPPELKLLALGLVIVYVFLAEVLVGGPTI